MPGLNTSMSFDPIFNSCLPCLNRLMCPQHSKPDIPEELIKSFSLASPDSSDAANTQVSKHPEP